MLTVNETIDLLRAAGLEAVAVADDLVQIEAAPLAIAAAMFDLALEAGAAGADVEALREQLAQATTYGAGDTLRMQLPAITDEPADPAVASDDDNPRLTIDGITYVLLRRVTAEDHEYEGRRNVAAAMRQVGRVADLVLRRPSGRKTYLAGEFSGPAGAKCFRLMVRRGF